MDFSPLPGADERLSLVSENNNVTLWESSDDSDIEVIKELKTTLETHECDLCCEGQFLVNRLLQFGGVLNKDMKFACEICDKGFKVKSGLSMHMKQHLKPNKPRSSNSRNTALELSNVLNVSNISNSSNSSSVRFSCDFCSNSYKTKYSLQRHLKKKHIGKAYVCEICKAKYSNYDQFTIHCSSHSESSEKIYACPNCGIIFSMKKDLKKHICTSVE